MARDPRELARERSLKEARRAAGDCPKAGCGRPAGHGGKHQTAAGSAIASPQADAYPDYTGITERVFNGPGWIRPPEG